MTGLDINPSGTPVFSRSDVGGAYRLDGDVWTNVVTAISIPASDVSFSKYDGVLSIVSAPSDPDIAYMAYGTKIFRSDDQGETWVATNLVEMEMSPNNDESKLGGERLSVDPNNPDVLYFGSIQNGLYRSLDGGASYTQVSQVPNGEADRGIRQILFDPSSAVSNGQTQRILAFSDGEGVFESLDGGDNWSEVTFSHTQPYFLDAEISPNGLVATVGLEGEDSFGVQILKDGVWNNVTPDANMAFGEIALDPFDENRAFVFSYGFTDTYKTESLTATTTNWDFVDRRIIATKIDWFEYTFTDWFSMGEAVFSSNEPGKIWISDGIGTFTITNLDEATLDWVENADGQEHLVSNDLAPLPDGKAVTLHWDRPVFRHDNLETYPSIHQPSSRFNSAWDIDYSLSDPNFLVAIIEDHRFCCLDSETRNSGYSTDGGITWTQFASMPLPNNGQVYGNIAVSHMDNDNIVWVPGFGELPHYSRDRGTTWTQADLPGATGSCCLDNNFFSRRVLAASRSVANRFYVYDWGDGSIFRSENGGETWTRFTNNVLTDFAYNGKLVSVPGQEGHLFFANGPEQATNFIEGLYRSTDAGETWTILANTDQVLNVSLGAQASDGTYPTIFIQGMVNGEMGYYLSKDEGQSWDKIGEYPQGIYDYAKVLEADPYEYGKVYAGFKGNGFVYYEDPRALSVSYALELETLQTMNGVQLTWTSLEEINSEVFVIERSEDRVSFNSIGEVEALGSNTSYQFMDQNPLSGRVFYRLKEIEFDGTHSYSHIVEFNSPIDRDFRLHPNPVRSVLKIEGLQSNGEYRIMDVTGRVVMEFTAQPKVDLSGISRGLYFIVEESTGKRRTFTKL